MKAKELSTLRSQILTLEDKIRDSTDDINLLTESYLVNARVLPNISQASDSAEVISSIHSSDIVYIGDWHHISACQDTQIKILKKMVSEGMSFGLGMEMVYTSDQKILNTYMRGDINEVNFLGAINYSESWGYPWSGFRRLFDLAREANIPVFGLDYKRVHNPQKRDEKVSKRIAKLSKKCSKLAVIYGNAHLHPTHLPTEVAKLTDKSQLTIFQDNQGVYLEAAEKDLEKSKILKLVDGNYNIINTSPIIVKRGELMWNKGCGKTALAYKHLVIDIINYLTGELGIPRKKVSPLPSVITSIKTLEARLSKKNFREFCESPKSIYIPSINSIFIVGGNMITLAEESMHFVHFNYGNMQSKSKPLHPLNDFYKTCIAEAIGAFGSRLVVRNKMRISNKMLRQWLSETKSSNSQAANYVILHKMFEEASGNIEIYLANKFTKLFNEDPLMVNMVAHILGYMLGDKMFESFSKKKYDLKDFKKLLKLDLSKPNLANMVYLDELSPTFPFGELPLELVNF